MFRLTLALCITAATASAQIFGDAQLICPLPDGAPYILTCNLDGNQYDDIVLSPGLLVIMNGPSGLSEPISIPWSGCNMRAADLNNDGLDDILTGNAGPILFSNGDGSFTPSSCNILAHAVPADFNDDGMPDLLMAQGNSFLLALNQDNADTFAEVWSGVIPTWPGCSCLGFFTGDIAGDEYTDFAVIHNYGIRVYIAQGGCTSFSNMETEDDLYAYLVGPPPYTQCDINNDGHPDLLNSSWSYGINPEPILVSEWKDDPGLWYWHLNSIPANSDPVVGGCDFNGDGYDEVFYSDCVTVTVLQGTAAGMGPEMYSTPEDNYFSAGFGHIAGGPVPDLLAVGYSGLYWFENLLTEVEGASSAAVLHGMVVSENPFSEYVEIITPFPGTISIFDCSGRRVNQFYGSTFSWYPEDLPAGSYLVTADTPERSCCRRVLYLPE